MEERMQLGANQMNVWGSGTDLKAQTTDSLPLLLLSCVKCVPYFLWGSGTEPKECKHGVVLLWEEKVFIVLEDKSGGHKMSTLNAALVPQVWGLAVNISAELLLI